MSLEESREAWFQSLVINQKINSTGEALQICFSLIEGSWSRRSKTFCFVHDVKLRHALTSCRSMINLAIEAEKNDDAASAEFWFWTDMVTSGVMTVLFVLCAYFYKKLRDSKTVRRTCKSLLTSKEDSTAWGKSMAIDGQGVPSAHAWFSRSTNEKLFNNGDRHDNLQFHTPMQFSNPTEHDQFRPSAPAPPSSLRTRAGYPPSEYPGSMATRNQTLDPIERNQARNQILEPMDKKQTLDQMERKETPSNQDPIQDIDQEMIRLRNEIRKISNEKEARSMRENMQ